MNRRCFLLSVATCLLAADSAIAQPSAAFGRPWTKVPSLVALAQEGDARLTPVQDAVEFWNRTLGEIGTPFRLGPVTRANGDISANELRAASEQVLSRSGPPSFSKDIGQWEGDIVVALSSGSFISFAIRWPERQKALVAIRSDRTFPLTLPNVARNLIAHELGHAIGLSHNSDPAMLMCGRPAPCRPDVFASSTPRFFPLSDTDRAKVLAMYPAAWKSR